MRCRCIDGAHFRRPRCLGDPPHDWLASGRLSSSPSRSSAPHIACYAHGYQRTQATETVLPSHSVADDVMVQSDASQKRVRRRGNDVIGGHVARVSRSAGRSCRGGAARASSRVAALSRASSRQWRARSAPSGGRASGAAARLRGSSGRVAANLAAAGRQGRSGAAADLPSEALLRGDRAHSAVCLLFACPSACDHVRRRALQRAQRRRPATDRPPLPDDVPVSGLATQHGARLRRRAAAHPAGRPAARRRHARRRHGRPAGPAAGVDRPGQVRDGRRCVRLGVRADPWTSLAGPVDQRAGRARPTRWRRSASAPPSRCGS